MSRAGKARSAWGAGRAGLAALVLSGLVMVAVGAAALWGCYGQRASASDCARILDRIVELELRERGFHDAALLERKRVELRRSLARDLDECRGKPLRRDALACVSRATSSEQISHLCLR
ncbi:MAG: hypothetical protein ABSB49_01105 [Polyangia bacterium]